MFDLRFVVGASPRACAGGVYPPTPVLGAAVLDQKGRPEPTANPLKSAAPATDVDRECRFRVPSLRGVIRPFPMRPLAPHTGAARAVGPVTEFAPRELHGRKGIVAIELLPLP